MDSFSLSIDKTHRHCTSILSEVHFTRLGIKVLFEETIEQVKVDQRIRIHRQKLVFMVQNR